MNRITNVESYYLKSFICVQIDSNTWNHLTVYKQMNSSLFKNVTYKLFIHKSYI